MESGTIVIWILVMMMTVTTADISREEGICNNIDIRNSVDNLKKHLSNCTVVEGYVRIVLVDRGDSKEFENLSFPLLREITSYLLLYRVKGLQSVGKLFPNLAVIRGEPLFHNYALVIFEMFSLVELGMHHLTDILRGSVRIEKNPKLCHVNTIDWDRIAPLGKGGHFIQENGQQCTSICNDSCPSGSDLQKLCWNADKCQKVCSEECIRSNRTCDDKGKCCDVECLGGCVAQTRDSCSVCRKFLYDNRCVTQCPINTYEYMGRRCVTENECHNIRTERQEEHYYKAFDRKCSHECPPGYTEDEDKHICKRCDRGNCPKICMGALVDSVSAAENFHGCTFINGSLEIQIRGGDNIMKELERHLSSIEKISDYLKIARSFSLVSLNFLKNLREIQGNKLDMKDYSFVVLDNQNLQELWDWKNKLILEDDKKLEVTRGKIFFHFNPQLCLHKIEELKSVAKVNEWDDRDVSPSTNGERAACNVSELNVTLYRIGSKNVILKWPNFRREINDQRNLLGYVVNYREAPFKNVTMFDGRDACGGDLWKTEDVEAKADEKPPDSNNTRPDEEITVITQLTPYTQYAVYVTTYTLHGKDKNAQSKIFYFTTMADTPSFPTNLLARSVNHSAVIASWSAPKYPNGNVRYYRIIGVLESETSFSVSRRDYCTDPVIIEKSINDEEDSNMWTLSSTVPPVNTSAGAECCSCDKDHKTPKDPNDVQNQKDFEDYLHNVIFIKNPQASFRTKRSTQDGEDDESINQSDMPPNTTSSDLVTEEPSFREDCADIRNNDGTYLKFCQWVEDTNYTVQGELRHFSQYTIKVMACHEKPTEKKKNEDNITCAVETVYKDKRMCCSLESFASVRTKRKGGADDIFTPSVKVNSINDTVILTWNEPDHPNQYILSYHVEYKIVTHENVKPVLSCVTRTHFNHTQSLTLHGLKAGNYSFRIMATSLGGSGNWTEPIFYLVRDRTDTPHIQVVIIVSIVVGLIVLVAILSIGYLYAKKKFSTALPDSILYASINPEYMSSGVYEPDEWEVARDKITLIKELGQGSFGMVYEGVAHDLFPDTPELKCAVKTVNESASLSERIEFLQEASVMKAFLCHHVVKLLGVVSKGQPVYVIMELMANGDLKGYLRSHRPDLDEQPKGQPPSLKQILQMAAQIADGMAYLSANKFVHRDLAARNCMVSEDLTVKIGDFGMTRDIYETDYYRKGGKGLLPVRWMAPESLKDGVFTSQSDVWSYGVVLWEMATLAQQPYQGLSNEMVLKYVINKGIMEKPENCPEKLYQIMKLCWAQNPKARPNFVEIIEMLLPDVNARFHEMSFYYTQSMKRDEEPPEDNVSPSTPLKAKQQEDVESLDSRGFEEDVKFYPSVTMVAQPVEQDKNRGTPSNEGSKAMSLPSSDGSKGSKVSSISNGSLANGHIYMPANRTTAC